MKSKFTKFKQLALAMAFLFFSGMVFGQDVTLTQSFTSNGSWTVPAGVTEITIECIGGGGAGGYVHGSGFILKPVLVEVVAHTPRKWYPFRADKPLMLWSEQVVMHGLPLGTRLTVATHTNSRGYYCCESSRW